MMPFFDWFTASTSLGVGIATVLIGMNASPERARKMLGSRVEQFSAIDDETLDMELSRAVRATYWGLPGISCMVLIAVFFRTLTYASMRFPARWWIVLILGMSIGATISYLQGVIYRAGIVRYLERRFSTP